MHDDVRTHARDTRDGHHAAAAHAFRVGLARAFGGAIVFAVPALMTMELWWLGFHIDPLRLAILLVVAIPFLTGLSYFTGIKESFAWQDDLLDSFVAIAVGAVASALVLGVLAIVGDGMSLDEIVGKIAIQTFPCSVGAVLAESMLGEPEEGQEETRDGMGYQGELFHMLAGSIFLSLSLAPTEEMVLIAYTMGDWHLVMLPVVTLVLMHGFMYAVGDRGHEEIPHGSSAGVLFAQFTIVAYAVALLVSLYILWTFGRLDGASPDMIVRSTLVLGFPSAIGAAAARLLL